MAQTSDNTLEARIAALESAVRSLRATNLTDLASVVDASGHRVPLSSLAFGQVVAVQAQTGLAPQTAVAGVSTLTVSPGDYTHPANWVYLTDPHVDVLVTGGRLRIDWAASLFVDGGSDPVTNTQNKEVYHSLSYALDFLGASDAASGTRVVQPDPQRALEVRDNGHYGAVLQAGSFYVHTGLTPGWYRASLASFLGHYAAPAPASGGYLPQSSIDYPRIGATPF